MASSEKSPLLSSQREKAGSQTAADYAYQYHWALYRAIQQFGKQQFEFAVFVELHEDVVISNSLDSKIVKFEFNQIKTTKAKFTKQALIRRKDGKMSVLGKLISSSTNKPFAKSVTELNLIAVSGFGLKLNDPGLSLNKITIADINSTDLAALTLAIKQELKLPSLPNNLQFIIPDLSDSRYQNDVIGEISKLISSIFPGSNYNSYDMYLVLIDELNRKGAVTYDFTNWDDLLENKALTSVTIRKIINQFINVKDEAKIETAFTSIAVELKLNTLSSRDLKRGFDRYRQLRIGNKNVSQLDISNAIQMELSDKIISANNDFSILIDSVFNSLDQKIKTKFSSDIEIRAAIICEYIMTEA